MRFPRWLLPVLASFALAAPLAAKICVIDEVPAATLLLPYFEVDLGPTTTIDTVFSINNALNQEVVAKVEVWSDLGVAIFGFNVHLSGYDVQVIDLRDVSVNGLLPATQPGIFASCIGALPPPPLPAALASSIRKSLTGQAAPAFGDRCAGVRYFDNIARGYITVDTVSNCTLRFPGDLGYFAGDATDQNALWGDYYITQPAKGFAHSESLVHLEASATDVETSVAGQYTFYGKFVGWSGIDHREPLATNFGARYVRRSLAAGSGGTDFLVWRDPKVVNSHFTCPAITGRPSWYPLGQERVVAFDESEHSTVLGGNPFPAAAQRSAVGAIAFYGEPSLPTPYALGWAYLNLNATIPSAGSNPPEDPSAAQAWVTAVTDAGTGGLFSIGHDALQLDSACQAIHPSIP